MGGFTCASRTFYSENQDGKKYVVGSIEVTPSNTKDSLMLNILGLQDNGFYLDYGQATIIVKYPKEMCVYEVIMCVFDKLTEDHRYKLKDLFYDKNTKTYYWKDMEHKDAISCSEEFVEMHPEMCRYDDGYIGHWIPFTKENSQYLDYDTYDIDEYTDESCIILYGEVQVSKETKTLEFTYDSPIISKHMSKEYYDITRGRIVWDVQINETTKQYYVDPYVEPTDFSHLDKYQK